MELLGADPKASAARVFPAAAKANRGIFYAAAARKVRKAKALSVAEVYERFDRMIDRRIDRYGPVLAFAETGAVR